MGTTSEGVEKDQRAGKDNSSAQVLRYIVFRGERIELSLGTDNLWRDKLDTVYAFKDDSMTVDPVVRCGIGMLSLPVNHPLTAACRPHDFMYTSPAFQAFYTRAEADAWLRNYVEQIYPGLLGKTVGAAFEELAQIFGARWWEFAATNTYQGQFEAVLGKAVGEVWDFLAETFNAVVPHNLVVQPA